MKKVKLEDLDVKVPLKWSNLDQKEEEARKVRIIFVYDYLHII